MGLLIKTWGQVSSVGDGYVMVDDGSGPVRMDTSALASQPELYSYISVVGISSLHSAGSLYGLVLPRDESDVTVRSAPLTMW